MQKLEFIKNRKVNSGVVIALLFLSFCLSSWVFGRGDYYFNLYYQGASGAILANDIIAFIIGGVVPILIYELLTFGGFKFYQRRLGIVTYDLKYVLRFFYIAANIVIFLISLLTFVVPPVMFIVGVFLEFVVTATFFILFLLFCAKNYVEKENWGVMLKSLGIAFLIVYLLVLFMSGLI